MFKSVLIILLFFFTSAIYSQSKMDTVIVKTNVYCNHCKKCESCGGKIETQLLYTKGIKEVIYNEKEMTIMVVYKKEKTSVDLIKTAITKLGYDADDLQADMKAYEGLDNCCKKD